MTHIPVLQQEVIQFLNPQPNKNYIDCTFGEGGHSLALLEKIKPNGKILAIEIDPVLYKKGLLKKKRLGERLILVNDSFVNLEKIVKKLNFQNVHGVLFDLGISSWHLEESGRGFTFKKDEPLLMRYNGKSNNQVLTAYKILNEWESEKIEKILKEYAQEKFAKRIAIEIEKARKKTPIETTFQLVEIIRKAVPLVYQKRKIHFATKTFLALRIATNEEIENLKKGLEQALRILEKKGRLAVISFHSTEDKIVKEFFRERKKRGELKILTKKPIIPSNEEVIKNPRSRSAKLRVGEKL